MFYTHSIKVKTKKLGRIVHYECCSTNIKSKKLYFSNNFQNYLIYFIYFKCLLKNIISPLGVEIFLLLFENSKQYYFICIKLML